MKPSSKSQNRTRTLWKTVVVGVVVFLVVPTIVLLAAIPSLVMGPWINEHVVFATIYDPVDFGLEVRELSLVTSDQHKISAFEVEAEAPRGVIIFISGIHNPSVTAYYGHARIFKEHGYASILYDMRGHGESSGDQICLGYLEPRDTRAVVDYILAQERYKGVPMIVYGLSMGGAVAINSIGQIPELSGLVSISAYSSFEDMFVENMRASGAPALLTAMEKPFVKLYSLWKFGWSTRDIYPTKQIHRLGDRPALLLHSLGDEQVAYANFERIVARAPAHVQTWTRTGDEHLFTWDFLHPENDLEYMERVLEFLTSNFK